jgi:HSP20 family molecular chaperone IbpA
MFSASSCDELPAERAADLQDRFAPALMIHETPDAYDIEADLARASRRDVSVKPHPRYLEIRCSHAIDHAGDDDEASRFGSFVTRVSLGDAIDVAHTDIVLRRGVLRIHAPKRLH